MDEAGLCQALVREADHDRYLATLFAPAEARPALFALAAFNLEIARVRDAVSAPLSGEIRLQWWRDALALPTPGDAMANPVARELLAAVEGFRLPRAALLAMIDARVFDLYDDPMPSMADLEGYAGETAAALLQLGAIVLAGGEEPGTAEAAGHAGVAVAIAGLLRNLPAHAARGQLYLPRDVLERHGVGRAQVLAGETTPALRAALAEMIAAARRHRAFARAALGSAPAHGPRKGAPLARRDHARKIAPEANSRRSGEPARSETALVRRAFILAALVEPYLRRLEDPRRDPLRDGVELPSWRRILLLWRAARGGI